MRFLKLAGGIVLSLGITALILAIGVVHANAFVACMMTVVTGHMIVAIIAVISRVDPPWVGLTPDFKTGLIGPSVVTTAMVVIGLLGATLWVVWGIVYDWAWHVVG